MKTTPTNKPLNILLLADHKSKFLYDYYEPEKVKDIDLIISCGDLPPEYLSFFVTLCNVPLLYVRGNHDKRYDEKPPEGCICIEDDIYVHEGIRILGLGGSMEYIPRSKDQYTEHKMKQRVREPSIWTVCPAAVLTLPVKHATSITASFLQTADRHTAF